MQSGIIEDIYKVRRAMMASAAMPDECRVSPDAYIALRASADLTRLTTFAGEEEPQSVFGLKIVIDPTLKPGEWKLVSPSDRE